MTLRNQVLVWVGFFVATILLLWIFRPILLPFVVGMALAYLLNPVVSLIGRIGISRPWASAIVLVVGILVILGMLVMLVPLVGQQVVGLITRLPGYVTDLQALAQGLVPELTEWLGPERTAQLEASLAELITRGVEMAGAITAQVAQSGLTVVNTIAILFITPVVAFYLLLDWEGMTERVDDLLPRAYRDEIQGVLNQIDKSMAGVIRGQGSVVLVLCIYYATALSLVGLNFGLAIGLFGGLLSFVPYVGFAIGFVLSMTVALVQFWPDQWLFVLIVLAVYLVGQFLEANILYPKLVGQSININPVWLMFALFAFGLLFGFVGLLLAVPLAAITGVLTRYALAKYQASSLYRGPEPDPAAPKVDLVVPPVRKPPARRPTRAK